MTRRERYDDKNGLHVHRCECGATWQHPHNSAYPGAHDCPRCGEYENLKADLSSITVIDYPWASSPFNPAHKVTIRERVQKDGYVLVWQHEITAGELELRCREAAIALLFGQGRQRSERHG